MPPSQCMKKNSFLRALAISFCVRGHCRSSSLEVQLHLPIMPTFGTLRRAFLRLRLALNRYGTRQVFQSIEAKIFSRTHPLLWKLGGECSFLRNRLTMIFSPVFLLYRSGSSVLTLTFSLLPYHRSSISHSQHSSFSRLSEINTSTHSYLTSKQTSASSSRPLSTSCSIFIITQHHTIYFTDQAQFKYAKTAEMHSGFSRYWKQETHSLRLSSLLFHSIC
jgi:hypothetical protein